MGSIVSERFKRCKRKMTSLSQVTGLFLMLCVLFSGCGRAETEAGQETVISVAPTESVSETEVGTDEGDGGITPTEAVVTETVPEENDTTVTIMIYMDAATLESGEEPFASYDMEQMYEAELSDQVSVLIQTGGTAKWTNPEISTRTTQRYRLAEGTLELVEDTGEQQDMTDPETLKEFILFSAKAAPADRYMLILWGHGRGPQIGYGMDDFQNAGKAMALEDMAGAIEAAIAEAGIALEWIGFDVCLMGNLETVYALRNCCEYLAVSEDYEPAYGWQYTKLLNALSENPALSNKELAQVIVDGFMEEAERSGDRGIMAVIDMIYAEELMTAWEAFCTAQDEAAEQAQKTVDELVIQVWSDENLLTPVPTGVDGYVTDDYLYSLQDYGLTDVQAICELAGTPEAEAMMELLQESIVCVESFHMARTMCGLAVGE